MPSIIVTTPKSRMEEAADEAADAKRYGGDTRYFRQFEVSDRPRINAGDRVYYVEDGFVRGFAVVDEREVLDRGRHCHTTDRWYGPGFYVWMRADSWQWISPIPLRGFQGFRYADDGDGTLAGYPVQVVGGWLDTKPGMEGK